MPDIVDQSQHQTQNENQNQNQGSGAQAGQQPQGGEGNSNPVPVQGQSPNEPPVQNHPSSPASPGLYQSSDAQFSDLQNRLQNMMKHFSTLSRDFNDYSKKSQGRHDDLMAVVRGLERRMSDMRSVKEKIEEVQRDVKQTKADLHSSLDRHFAGLKGDVRETTTSKFSIAFWFLVASISSTHKVW